MDDAEGHSLTIAGRCSSDEVIARASNNLASFKHLHGDLAAARDLYRPFCWRTRGLGDHPGQAESRHNLAIAVRKAGDLAEAIRADGAALEDSGAGGEPGTRALIHSGLAESAVLHGDPTTALSQLDQAEFQAWTGRDPLASAEVHRVRAGYLGSIGEPARGLEVLDRATATADQIGNPLLRAGCAALAARLFRQLGRDGEAAPQVELAKRLFLSLGAVAHLDRLD